MEPKNVTVIIVNYNSGHWLERCLIAIRKSSIEQLIVIDNGSTDQSLACLQGMDNLNIELIKNSNNPGYAVACNQGLEKTRGEFTLFLNPDCELLEKALESLCTALEDNQHAILAGPWVINRHGKVQRATVRKLPNFNSSMYEFLRPRSEKGIELSSQVKPTGVQTVQAVSGACLLARTDLLRDLGGFDPGYRLHCEDLDLMQRAALAGHSVLLVPDALVIHQQGISSRGRPVWVEWQKHRGMLRYYKKFEAEDDNRFKQIFVWISVLGHFAVKSAYIWYQKLASKARVND